MIEKLSEREENNEEEEMAEKLISLSSPPTLSSPPFATTLSGAERIGLPCTYKSWELTGRVRTQFGSR